MDNNIYDYLEVLKKIDIEFENDDGKYTSLKSYIKSMTEDGILIEPPTKNGITYNVPVGHPVNIIVNITNGGLCVGESKVIAKELSTISGLWINYPFNSRIIQRREFLRVPMPVLVEFSIYKDINRTEKEVFKVLTKDISGNGISYLSDSPLTDYYDIECKIYLDDDPPIWLKCENIANHMILDQNKETKFIVAFKYIDIKSNDIKKIVNACFKYQLELRKKGLL